MGPRRIHAKPHHVTPQDPPPLFFSILPGTGVTEQGHPHKHIHTHITQCRRQRTRTRLIFQGPVLTSLGICTNLQPLHLCHCLHHLIMAFCHKHWPNFCQQSLGPHKRSIRRMTKAQQRNFAQPPTTPTAPPGIFIALSTLSSHLSPPRHHRGSCT